MTNNKSQISNLKSQIPRRIYHFLSRTNVAAVLIAIVLLLAVLGSCLPQLTPTIEADPERLARWEAAVRARYGALTDLLIASEAFRCFRSPVFLVSVTLLALSTLVCTLNRWRAVWRRAFHQPVRCSDVALDGAPYTARLTAPMTVDLPHIVRESLKPRDFRVRTTEVATTNHPTIHLRGDRYRLAPLATLVTHLAVLLLLLGAALSSGYGWREELTIGPGEVIEAGHGSGVALCNEGFTITRYPDGSVASYEAKVAIIAGGQEVVHDSVLVNEPLHYGPVRLYLQAYAGTPDGYSVTLLAVHDPGYGVVITAGFLLLLGLTVSFNFPHCWIHARIEPEGACPEVAEGARPEVTEGARPEVTEGTLRLAGRDDRRAHNFGREFEALVEEIRRTVGMEEGMKRGGRSC
ncbi:MAG: cytochrome c biogenesis protein ResB [Chloroflexota bacterium]|nr:cytochrome c biogenesis protein ResB [Chloroflexota bacterium]